MTILQVLFYLFAGIAMFSAFMVVVSRNTVKAVLFLVLTFVSTAGIWMMLNAEFLSLILVLVYVGAVMTLFLFVVMMLNVDLENLQKAFVRYLPLAAIVVLLVVGLIVMAVGPSILGLKEMPAPVAASAQFSNTEMLGNVLYTEYAYPFEIAAVMLLTSIVAAISLTHREPKNRKVQRISQQVAVRREQRVRLVAMKGERKKP